MVNEKSSAVGVNIQEKATMIWNVADVLRGPFKPHEYGLVILPMTVVKRFHGETAAEEIGVRPNLVWWRRGESNSRPKAT